MVKSNDGGYGLIGNITKNTILNEILDKKSGNEYREQLKRENKEKYEEYLQYEKMKA